jgi:hypothetical protein
MTPPVLNVLKGQLSLYHDTKLDSYVYIKTLNIIRSTAWQSWIFIEAPISRTRQGVYAEVHQQPGLIYLIRKKTINSGRDAAAGEMPNFSVWWIVAVLSRSQHTCLFSESREAL